MSKAEYGQQVTAYQQFVKPSRKMPAQKPGLSKQDYGTPWALIRAVEKRWGKLGIDLAAHDDGDNAKAPLWFGESDDYLSQPFTPGGGLQPDDALCWCNPPFDNLGAWARKWKADAAQGARIIALVPASIGSEWFRLEVSGVAQVIGLSPRIRFQGCHVKTCHSLAPDGDDSDCDGCATYPKDCMLLLYGRDLHVSPPGYELNEELRNVFSLIPWRWDQE